MIRTLIVDDEQLARERLRLLLKAYEDVEVIGEAETGEQALECIAQEKPDLVLLDIQMPGCSGLEVAAALPPPRPRIIFCTAYDQYAIDAFELHAVDYLLKPVNRARLSDSLQRIRNFSRERGEAALESALEQVVPAARRFLVRKGSRFAVIPQEQVLYFSTREGLTRLHCRERNYWMESSLAELEKRLDPAEFYRISRQAIVRLSAIQEVAPLVGGYGQVRLTDGSALEVSRRRMKELLERLA